MVRTLPFIVPRESDVVPLIRKHVASGTIIHADESNAWERLHASYDTRRVNHSLEYVADDGTSVNQAESYFSRLRRAEFGVHHRISGYYLYQYANEMAWRGGQPRIPNGLHWRRIWAPPCIIQNRQSGAAIGNGARHDRQRSCRFRPDREAPRTAGIIDEMQRQIDQRRADLTHIDGVLRVLVPISTRRRIGRTRLPAQPLLRPE